METATYRVFIGNKWYPVSPAFCFEEEAVDCLLGRGQKVEKKSKIGKWMPFTTPFNSEYSAQFHKERKNV